jgi:aerobic-type carbon monoxide dehydrogenase small subunit (CoxS/CutS family)
MPPVTELIVNGAKHQLHADPEQTLLSVLRDDLGLTGTKYGCGEGQCGACTVLIDGLPTRSCTKLVGSVGQKEITTIEGASGDGRLHPLQQAFVTHNALQCGYCTPGMIMAGLGLLRKNSHPTDQQIVEAMDHNVCRCGTYPRIVAAIRQAAKVLQEGQR